MKVFIGWSGSLSEQVARVLREWIPTVLSSVQPWMSSEDIDKGAQWVAQLSSELSATSFGILCLVPNNLDSPWLNFEAGALARSIDSSRVSPFLLGVPAADLRGPIGQFQATLYDENDLRRLVLTINKACGGKGLPQERLDQAFRVCWPWLRTRLDPLLEQAKLSSLPLQASLSSPVDVTGKLTNPFDSSDQFRFVFDFEVIGDVLLGTIRQISTTNDYALKKGILDGKIQGTVISFSTPEQSLAGFSQTVTTYKNLYYGSVLSDTIEFILHSDRLWGFPSQKFVANRE
jgi:TIR domain